MNFTFRDFLILAAIAMAAFVVGAAAGRALRQDVKEPGNLTPNDWLLSAPDEEERFRRIQTQLRGFDQTMWEVGERFRRIYEALGRDNTEMALYHWEKIGVTVRNGIARRPARSANSEAMFLGANFESIRAGFQARTPEVAWGAFDRARLACQACHVAEKVEFINRQPLFDLTASEAHGAIRQQ